MRLGSTYNTVSITDFKIINFIKCLESKRYPLLFFIYTNFCHLNDRQAHPDIFILGKDVENISCISKKKVETYDDIRFFQGKIFR